MSTPHDARTGRDRPLGERLLKGLIRCFVSERVLQEDLRRLRFELGTWLALRSPARWAERRRFAGRRDLRLQLGAGTRILEGWINQDARARTGTDMVFDLRERFPLDDGSVRLVYAEHVLEHLHPRFELPGFLAECVRVMAPGGRLRIVVPDGQLYLEAYARRDQGFFSALRPESATAMEGVNEVFRQGWQHLFCYDFETMALYLERAGFARVERSGFQASPESELRIDGASHEAESLYVEAIR